MLSKAIVYEVSNMNKGRCTYRKGAYLMHRALIFAFKVKRVDLS